jgi:hypothetical protein
MSEPEWKQSGTARLSKTEKSVILALNGECHMILLWDLKNLIDKKVAGIPIKKLPEQGEKKDEQ